MKATSGQEAMSITLPMTPYKVVVEVRGQLFTINLSPNSPDMKGAHFGRNPAFRSMLVSRAKQEMRDTAYLLARAQLQGRAVSPIEGHVRLDVTCATRRARRRDVDNLVASIKWALDGICRAIPGLDDSMFVIGDVVFEKGDTDSTTISWHRV